MSYTLTVQVNPKMQVRGATDASGGYANIQFETPRDMQAFMGQFRSAAMPCWKRLETEGAEIFRTTRRGRGA